ncbi:head-tail connector protein [Mesorhizobium retamae]|uniref:Phage gp6-like head-tail connector protein n=1 Tax=Mesorhizobium retamae TaxID=2912854 RepID=A0ABS9QK05_9HYPH|nr:head-tail connector protein [Mesorhizobium sp. IRAMC:0171]MCG7507066.1 phage gp6-like head-tail connector protein [Mesorhizobium sp. IRAMC:0171]
MWLTPKVVTPPTVEPVSLPEAKRHARAADFNDDDDYLEDLIAAGRNHAEGYCGAFFSPCDVEVSATDWCDFNHVPTVPLGDVTSIEYVDTTGAVQTVSADVYERRDNAIVTKYGKQWPPIQIGSLIKLTATVGFEDCPSAVKHAMLLWIAGAYEKRESAALDNWTTMDALLCNHRYY